MILRAPGLEMADIAVWFCEISAGNPDRDDSDMLIMMSEHHCC